MRKPRRSPRIEQSRHSAEAAVTSQDRITVGKPSSPQSFTTTWAFVTLGDFFGATPPTCYCAIPAPAASRCTTSAATTSRALPSWARWAWTGRFSVSATSAAAHRTFTAYLKLGSKSARLHTMRHRGGPMPDSHIDDPKHWLARAKEARAIADEMKDLDAKQRMLGIAKDYVRLAERAEARAKGLPQSN